VWGGGGWDGSYQPTSSWCTAVGGYSASYTTCNPFGSGGAGPNQLSECTINVGRPTLEETVAGRDCTNSQECDSIWCEKAVCEIFEFPYNQTHIYQHHVVGSFGLPCDHADAQIKTGESKCRMSCQPGYGLSSAGNSVTA
jgi:hypothetical protein